MSVMRATRIFTVFIVFCSLAACQNTSDKKGDKGEKDTTAVTIAYEKYQLDNGLTVILHEDHSDPLVHVDVTYHVGSAREEVGKSGFAHFFEHMMFQGSKHVADEQHFKIITDYVGFFFFITRSFFVLFCFVLFCFCFFCFFFVVVFFFFFAKFI